MGNVNLILGPPGTGKTTQLLNLVDEALSNGIRPDKIGFISFTKKSVNEARDRAVLRFNKNPKEFDFFRTIHSLSFRQLAMSPNQVLGRKQYRELGNTIGLQITGIHRQDQAVYEMRKGDQMVFIESLSRLKCETLEKTWGDADSDIPLRDLDHFQRTLDKYKKIHLLYDFTDMLTRYHQEGYKPKLDLLFVDEAQDLCQLQWNIVGAMIKESKQTYIAGDDDQAIFRWSGAAVNYFLGLSDKYDTWVLTTSYRLPKQVHNFSTRLVEQIKKRNKKHFRPRNEAGQVAHIGGLEDADLEKGTWLILVRNGYFIKDIVADVRVRGLFYETTYYSVSDDDALKAAFYWERLRAGKSITGVQSAMVVDHIGTKHIKSNRQLKKIEAVTKSDFIAMFNLDETFMAEVWYNALDLIPAEDIAYYRAVRRSGESFTKKPRIKISTIHGAKGGEAENVVIFPDMSGRTYNNMIGKSFDQNMEGYEDEIRVFYVAATRSSQNLFIVEPKTTSHFKFEGV